MSAYLQFLGTAGGRFAMLLQVRATGGLWLETPEGALHIDPGPGALVRARQKKLPLHRLRGILLSHRHLDHCADLNVMTEVLTQGAKKRTGTVLLPRDALEGEDPILLQYLRPMIGELKILQYPASYEVAGLRIRTIAHYEHGKVETFRFLLEYRGTRIAYFVDGRTHAGAQEAKGCDVLILYTVTEKPVEGIDHLSAADVPQLVRTIQPRRVILTHFGLNFLRQHPWERARELSEETGVPVIAAWDFMKLDLQTGEPIRQRSGHDAEQR